MIDADAMDGLVAQLQAIGDGLDAAFANAGSPDQYRGSVEGWHSTYDYWVSLADKAANDANVLTEWTRIGVKQAQIGQDYAQQLADTSLSARCAAFISTFPDAVAQVAAGALDKAKQATTAIVKAAEEPLREAAWGVSTIVLVLGAALALVFLMLSKSGAHVRAGPVAVG